MILYVFYCRYSISIWLWAFSQVPLLCRKWWKLAASICACWCWNKLHLPALKLQVSCIGVQVWLLPATWVCWFVAGVSICCRVQRVSCWVLVFSSKGVEVSWCDPLGHLQTFTAWSTNTWELYSAIGISWSIGRSRLQINTFKKKKIHLQKIHPQILNMWWGKAKFFTSAAGLLWQCTVTPYIGVSVCSLYAQRISRSPLTVSKIKQEEKLSKERRQSGLLIHAVLSQLVYVLCPVPQRKESSQRSCLSPLCWTV